MKLFYNNLIDRPLTVLSASTADPNLPVSNLANALRKRLYSTGTEANTDIFVDFGFAFLVSYVILLDVSTGDNAPDYEIYSSTDGVTYTGRGTWTAIGGTTQYFSFSVITARYWKIQIRRDINTDPITIGRLFLGQPYIATEPPDYDGLTITPTDPSNTLVSAGGQEYTDVKEHYDVVDLKFSDCPDAQVSTFQDAFSLCGMAVPLILLIENGFTKYYYVKFVKNPQYRVSNYDGGFKWNVTLNFKEQI